MILAAGVLVVKAAFLPGGTLASLDWRLLALAAALFVLTDAVKQTKKLHPILFILASAVVGVVLRLAE